ncbi:MAG: transcriptional repressor [Leptolyngbya sp. DLM2.Bin15]|nr:MAG: transcriptional repressor [Leptolyngbya sp. DLM2.Bin15]
MSPKRTRNQEKVLSVLRALGRGTSAQDLFVELRDRSQGMGLATVYRALDALKLEGVVQVRTVSSGEALYSLIQEDRHHLTCLQCGLSIAIDECPVHELQERLHDAYQFKIYYHTLEFFGLCTTCQTAQASMG